ncbi:hypothetical protein [Halosaccharopolyspora lacisalsi]|nr:hypothetical protein [Halosaccharopolyspora lacisalsi]
MSVVVCASVITASLALVVEDLIPHQADDGRVVPLRWVVFAGALLGLLLALWVRTVVNRRRGTLFHIHLLDEAMPDLRRTSVALAGARRMSMRAVTRWIDLGAHAHDDVIDLAEHCREVATTVEDAVNEDRDDTGSVLAPNMLWPTALAVGGYLPRADQLRLLELPPNDTADEIEFDLNPQDTDAVVRHDEPDLEQCTGRVGVWLAFTPAAAHFSRERFAELGVTTVHTLSYKGRIPPPKSTSLTGQDMTTISREIAQYLERIKAQAGERELVVIAMIPKAVALALGWHLAQSRFRFFRGTHLMHYDRPRDRFFSMRVRPSQPTHPPRPLARPAAHRESPLRNLTPYQLDMVTQHGTVTLPPTEQAPRITETTGEAEAVTVGGTAVPVLHAAQGEVADLPDPEPGVLLVVSRFVAALFPDRDDLLVPVDEVRDGTGRITGCRSLARLVTTTTAPCSAASGHGQEQPDTDNDPART